MLVRDDAHMLAISKEYLMPLAESFSRDDRCRSNTGRRIDDDDARHDIEMMLSMSEMNTVYDYLLIGIITARIPTRHNSFVVTGRW